MEKFCKNCVHYRSRGIYPRCKNPKVVGHNTVTGKINSEYCKDMRRYQGKCGEEGQHWERKRSVLERLLDKRREVVQRLDERY